MSISGVQQVLKANLVASRVLFHRRRFVAFGKSPCTDFARIGLAAGVKVAAVYDDGKKSAASDSECADLFSKVFEMSDPALSASFRISPWQVQFIQRTIKAFTGSHLTIFGDEDGLFFNCFDALRFLPQARMNRKSEVRVLTHQLSDNPSKPFHVTLNAASVLKLPRALLDVGIGDNKMVIFTDDKSSDIYLIRDLEVSAPMVNFFSDQLQTSISLVLPANSLLQGPGTNQPEPLEWEYDPLDLEHPIDP